MSIDKLTRGLEMSSSREGYKNVGALALTPTTSEDPLNSTLSEEIAKPSMAVPKGTELSKERGRIPTKEVQNMEVAIHPPAIAGGLLADIG